MQTRLVLWGENSAEEKILIALDLKEDKNEVEMWTFPHKEVTEDFFQLMMNEWRFGHEVSFPETSQRKSLEINLSEDLLPSDIKVSNTDLIHRAKTEWQFVIASNKMFKTYHAEIEDLQDKVNAMDTFSDSVWEEMKAYWKKVLKQIKDKNLYGQHADTLRKKTDEIFDALKELRKNRDAAFRDESESRAQKFFDALDEVEERVEKGLGLKPIFEELKEIQRNFRDTDMIRSHKNKVYKRIDNLFKRVKKERFGENASNFSPVDKMKNRYDGLLNAIKKMKKSIERDEKDLYYEGKRKDSSQGQLEEQLREAKLAMIEERINSKRNKLEDMHKTRESIESRLKRQIVKDQQKEEQKELEEAKKRAAEKIQKSIKEQQEKVDEEELRIAAASIKGKPSVKEEKVTTKEDETIENVAAVAALGMEEE